MSQISYEEAKSIATRLAAKNDLRIISVKENNTAYLFDNPKGWSFGGGTPYIILKATGEPLSMTRYIDSDYNDDSEFIDRPL